MPPRKVLQVEARFEHSGIASKMAPGRLLEARFEHFLGLLPNGSQEASGGLF